MGVKLGQKWAIKDGNLLASNQVGSRFFNKEFDFSRASNGTYVDRDGLLKTAELYNLVSYSEDFSTSWVRLGSRTQITINDAIGPFGVKNATKIEQILSVNDAAIRWTGLTIGVEYTFSVYAKKGNYDTLQMDISDISTQFTLTDKWVRYEITETATNNWVDLSIRNGSVGDYFYIFGAQVVEGTEPLSYQYTNGLQGLPRISFEDGVGHLLLEPQRSNLVTYSEDFSNAFWAKFNASVSSGFLSPDGLANAYKLIASVSNTEHRIRSASIATAAVGTTVTFSIYCKPQEITKIALVDNWTNLTYSVVNLSTNSVIEEVFYTGTGNTTITEMANGFKRISFTYETANINTLPAVYLLDEGYTSGNPTSYTFASNGTSGVYIYGAMFEAADYLTSYIKTEGTSVTRLADVCNNSGSAQDFNSEEGTIYAEASTLVEGGTSRHISINDGSFNNYVYLRYSLDSGRFQAFLRSGGGVLDSLSSVSNVQTDNNKIALVYKASEFSMWLNGTKVRTTTPTAMPIGLSQLEFDLNGVSNFYGKVRNLQVFTEALSDAELQQLTT